MVGPFRRLVALLALASASPSVGGAVAFDDPAPKPAGPDASPRLAPADYGLPGEDPPRAFVPAHPRSVEEQRRVESLRHYAAARAFEERRQLSEAIKTLEKALAGDPESIPVLRRLSRINFALGREAPAIAYSKRVIAADPGDIETVAFLVQHDKDDLPAAEAMLKGLAANPKLPRDSVGALYVQLELGNIYEATQRPDKAAACFARVVDALDEKTNARLAPSELRRFLGPDEGQAYLRFGRVFAQAKKHDEAIRAFRRGLVYDPDEPMLLLYLAQTCQEAGRGEDALTYLERFLKRQPRGRETYDLLAKILTTLKREDEIIPRFEKYRAADPKNVPLQYALADRYKAAGQGDKARAIYNNFLAEQRDTQDFAETFPRLLKERKTEELVALLVRVTARLKRIDPVKAQVEELVKDPAYTDEVLDAGLKMISANPPAVEPQEGWSLLVNIANEGKRLDKLAALWRWSLARTPNPIIYRELIYTLADQNKYAEAEAALKELLAKFRDEGTTRNLVLLARLQSRAGKADEAIATARDALKQDPNDAEGIQNLAFLLNQAGQADEAIALVQGVLKVDVSNLEMNALLGSFLTQAGKNDEAIALFRGLIDKFPNNDEVVKLARSSLSNLYVNMNDFAKGEAELEILFAKTPDDPGINNDLGYLYADQGKNLEKAEAMIRKALAEDPDNYAYLDSLGWVLFKRGKAEEARTSLEKAVNDPRADSTIPDHLGDVYFQIGEQAKAKAAWERAEKAAAKAKPVDKRLGEIRKKIQSLQQLDPSPRPSKGDKP